MSIRLRYAALAFRVAGFLLIALGIVRVTALFSGSPVWAAFTFYTVLSNVLCLVWMALLVVVTVRDLRRDGPRGLSTPSARFGGAVMEAITVTMLIYLVVLLPRKFVQEGAYEAFTLTDNLVHIVSAVLLIGDWLLFSPKGTFRWTDPLLWALIPYAYLAFAFVWHALGGTFGSMGAWPYPFLDVDELGVGGVAGWIAALTVALVAVGYVYVAIDRLLGRAAAPRRTTSAAAPRPAGSAARPR